VDADVPVQFFQSVIAIEMAIAGALLFQVRFFDRDRRERDLPDPRLSLMLAVVLGGTTFGSLWAIVDERNKGAAIGVTIGLAVSLLPILLRVLPPLTREVHSGARYPDYVVTLVGLIAYTALVALFVALVAT